MTSGFFSHRTAKSKITPNANAGSQCLSDSAPRMSPIVRRCTSTPEAT